MPVAPAVSFVYVVIVLLLQPTNPQYYCTGLLVGCCWCCKINTVMLLCCYWTYAAAGMLLCCRILAFSIRMRDCRSLLTLNITVQDCWWTAADAAILILLCGYAATGRMLTSPQVHSRQNHRSDG